MKKAILSLAVLVSGAASAQSIVPAMCLSNYPESTRVCAQFVSAQQIAMSEDRHVAFYAYMKAWNREVQHNSLKSECDRKYPNDDLGLLLCIRENEK